MQDLKELEQWWKEPDPWDYDTTKDDAIRKATLFSILPQSRFNRVLDIGCGNGFITTELPGDKVLGVDISKNAIRHAKERSKNLKHIEYIQSSIFDLKEHFKEETFDLIVITGVLYPQYIGDSNLLIYIIINKLLLKGGFIVSCHINEWYNSRFPLNLVSSQYYPYREYTHLLEVYTKI